MISQYLEKFIEKYNIEFVIANGENASHGKGLLKHHYQELINAGIDVITLGNHYNSKSEINKYIDSVNQLIRPVNLLNSFPGEGSAVFDVDGISIRVTNVLGTAFMSEEVSNPYYAVLEAMDSEEQANIHIVDYHAEATGEKISMAYAFDGKISALLGTHTHVQTHDARILEKGTAFISDVGMTGFIDGALGFSKEEVVRRNVYGEKVKFDLPNDGRGLFSAVVLDIDPITGLTNEIFPIYYVEEK